MASCFNIYSLKLTSIGFYVSSADHLKICVCVNQTISPPCYCILIVFIALEKSKHKASCFLTACLFALPTDYCNYLNWDWLDRIHHQPLFIRLKIVKDPV